MKKVFIIFISSMLFIGCTSNQKNIDDTKKHLDVNNNDISSNKLVDGFSFSNTSIIYLKEMSTLVTTITNVGSETIYLKSVNIILKNTKGDTLVTLEGYVGDNITAKESRIITASCSMDLTDAVSIEYVILK